MFYLHHFEFPLFAFDPWISDLITSSIAFYFGLSLFSPPPCPWFTPTLYITFLAAGFPRSYLPPLYISFSSTILFPKFSFPPSRTLDLYTCCAPLTYFLFTLHFFFSSFLLQYVHRYLRASHMELLGSKGCITKRMYSVYYWVCGDYKRGG